MTAQSRPTISGQTCVARQYGCGCQGACRGRAYDHLLQTPKRLTVIQTFAIVAVVELAIIASLVWYYL